MSVQFETEDRTAQASSMSLYTVVKAKDSEGSWKEVADIISISASGAGFYLPRACVVGTLVSLMVPMPENLRCYDHEKEFYKVWGLVQHSYPLKDSEGEPTNHVGVAFIGKTPPDSYHDDPQQTYRICGMNSIGLWVIEEAKTPFKARQHPRFRKSVDLYLAVLDAKQRTVGGEKAVTENISKSGAAVFTTLDVGVGDRVKFICEKYDFSGLAVVCNRQETNESKTRLHIQFVENEFPIARVCDSELEAEPVIKEEN
ncbi:MAG: PilZ domain-containing protein [Acidobacteriota bacterium]